MDVKRKIGIQGILIGIATTGVMMYVDKFVFSSSLASLFAGDWEILVWVVIFLFSMGTGVQSLQKRAITNAQIDEIDKKK